MDDRIIEYKGIRGGIFFWSRKTGLPPRIIQRRLENGLPIADVLNSSGGRRLSRKRKECTVDGCIRIEIKAGCGYCRPHKERLEKYGSPTGSKRVFTKEKAYATWQNLLARADASEIEWANYEEFSRDMGQPTKSKPVLCRKDWEKGFSKKNCFWGTRAQSRHLRMIKIDGVKKSIQEWSEITGLSIHTLGYRISQGWSDDKILRGRKDVVDA